MFLLLSSWSTGAVYLIVSYFFSQFSNYGLSRVAFLWEIRSLWCLQNLADSSLWLAATALMEKGICKAQFKPNSIHTPITVLSTVGFLHVRAFLKFTVVLWILWTPLHSITKCLFAYSMSSTVVLNSLPIYTEPQSQSPVLSRLCPSCTRDFQFLWLTAWEPTTIFLP